MILYLGMNFMNLLNYLQILKMLYLSLYYLGNLLKIFTTRNSLEDFENIVAIWLLKYFMKLLWSELYISNTLTCELLILVITPSVWLPRLCDDPICVTTRLCDDPFVWRPCHVALGEVSGFEMVLGILWLTMNNM